MIDLLTPEEVENARKNLEWGDPSPNEGLKHNQEAQSPVSALLQRKIAEKVPFHRYILPPKFNKYAVGDYYKPHTDSPFMQCGDIKVRTDLSCTIWLNDDYEGGELCVDGHRLKGKPGQCVIYRGDSIHEVTPVTKGERICAITWIQSEFRDAEIRQILEDLCTAMHKYKDPLIDNAVARLTKRYAET